MQTLSVARVALFMLSREAVLIQSVFPAMTDKQLVVEALRLTAYRLAVRSLHAEQLQVQLLELPVCIAVQTPTQYTWLDVDSGWKWV